MTDDELAVIDARASAASSGPWRSFIEGRDHLGGDDFIRVGCEDDGGADMYVTLYPEGTTTALPASAADLDFIAGARQDVPALIAEVRRLREAASGK